MEIQRSNGILMAIFKSLIKAVLLLQESDSELETLLKETTGEDLCSADR